MLALCEDVHWIDPSTLELLDLLIERVRGLPVLVVITFRPEFNPPWTGHAHVSALSLNRLGRREGAAIVQHITEGKALPPGVLDQIVSRTDGVPLFVEELTRMVLESGLLLDAGDRYRIARPLPPLAIPATLHDSLMARLDSAALLKEVAQIGATIGREFSSELLAGVAPLPDDRLTTPSISWSPRGWCSDAAPLQPPPTSSSTPSCRMRRIRVCSRADGSSSMAESQRCWRSSSPTRRTRPELLAYHFTEGGLGAKAVRYWHVAGRLRARALGDGRGGGPSHTGARPSAELGRRLASGSTGSRASSRAWQRPGGGAWHRGSGDWPSLRSRSGAVRSNRRQIPAVPGALRLDPVPLQPRRAGACP